jgi:hypothetical protein
MRPRESKIQDKLAREIGRLAVNERNGDITPISEEDDV